MTRFPTVTFMRLMRPVIGALTSVHSRLRRDISERRFGGFQRGVRLSIRALCCHQIRLRYHLRPKQQGGTCEIRLRFIRCRLGLSDRGLLIVEVGLKRPRINLEQQVALVNDRSFLERRFSISPLTRALTVTVLGTTDSRCIVPADHFALEGPADRNAWGGGGGGANARLQPGENANANATSATARAGAKCDSSDFL